ncbi:MAG: hypothetical protein ABJA76_09435 [Mucilaginibacter sp.]
MKRPFIYTALIVLIALTGNYSAAQDLPGAVQFHISSSHTSFPDTGRARGNTYDGKLYTAAAHYSDSSVLIIAPKNLDASKKVDLVFWFHGWGNNIDSAATRYELTKQFIASKRNAVLVLTETARNAPDSYGGKLENTGIFKKLVNDVLQGLTAKKFVPANCTAGHILLAGHSGAYRVIARILKNGQVPVDDVVLFDALYGETDKFMEWIAADTRHRFVDIYTDHGGTLTESKTMADKLSDKGISNFQVEEAKLVPQQLVAHRLLFIHSLKEHNDVVSPDNFRLMLENEPFLKKIK